MLTLATVALAGALLTGRAAHADPPPATAWTHAVSRGGVDVYLRARPGEALPTFRAETVVEAPLEWVAAQVEDGDHHARWFHHTIESHVLQRDGDTFWVYHHLYSPPPVAHRDVVLRVHREATAQGLRYRFEADRHPKAPPHADWIRMPRLDGVFELTREHPGRTRVLYRVRADPGGRLPPWMARRGVRDIALHTLLNLRALAAARPG